MLASKISLKELGRPAVLILAAPFLGRWTAVSASDDFSDMISRQSIKGDKCARSMHQPRHVVGPREVLITGLVVGFAPANVAAYLYALKELGGGRHFCDLAGLLSGALPTCSP
jgi:hypothetical protein